MDRAESLLKDIGMKEYEAKAFTAIVQNGVCSADQISKMSGVPLTRVYETMDSLQELGLVTVLNMRPKKYRLVSVEAISNLVEKKRRKMELEIERSNAVIKEIKNIMPKLPDHDAKEEIREGFWIFKGRETALMKITDEIKDSEKEVLYFSDDFSWFPRMKKIIEKKRGEGINFKVLMNVNEKTSHTASDILNINADIRVWEVNGLSGCIVDSKTIYLVSKIPRKGTNVEKEYGKEGSDDLFVYDCLTTENPIIVNMIKTYFDIFWWRGGKPNLAALKNGNLN